MSLFSPTQPKEGRIILIMGTKKRKTAAVEEQQHDVTEDGVKTQDNDFPSAAESVYADLLCPITQMLPINPVLGPDKQVYEASAYANYLKHPTKDNHGRILSPWTRQPMPNPDSQIDNPYTTRLILSWIDKGIISGTDAEKWLEARRILRLIDNIKFNSDADEHYELGNVFYHGENDYFPQDFDRAYVFYGLARNYGSVKGEAMAGICLLEGKGVNKDVTLASHYLASAAHKGSNLAAYRVSLLFKNDKWGMEDMGLETQFLELAISDSASHKHLGDQELTKAKLRLRKLNDDDAFYTSDDSDDSDDDIDYTNIHGGGIDV